jgi:hyperosmotically inducible protein
MKTVASTYMVRESALLTALTIAVLATGFAINTASASDTSAPQAHSDGIAAAIDDTGTTAKVKAKFMAENNLSKSDINVTTTNGVVTLEGTASNSNAKEMAGVLANSVEDVKSIDNSLEVPGSSTMVADTKRAMSDSWITTKVKSELLADSVSKGIDVSVETVHGVVVLKGALNSLDAVDHVKDIAANVEGVKSVDTEGLTVPSK